MKILNTPETALSIQVGIYKILKVHRFINASICAVALVQLKKKVSQKAPTDIAFYVELKNLHNEYATGDTHIRVLDLKGVIYVKEVDLIPKMVNNKLTMLEGVEWYKLDEFSMYDLYKKEGDNCLASPADEYDTITEALIQQQIDDAILENQADIEDDDTN